MRCDAIELHPTGAGQHAAHLRFEVVPLVVLEVVEDGEAALEEVLTEAGPLFVGHHPEARLPHIKDGVVEDLGVVQAQDAPLRVDVDQRELAKDPGEVDFGSRIVVIPGVAHASAAHATPIPPQTHEPEPAVVAVVRAVRIPPALLSADRHASQRSGKSNEEGPKQAGDSHG